MTKKINKKKKSIKESLRKVLTYWMYAKVSQIHLVLRGDESVTDSFLGSYGPLARGLH